MRWSNTALGGSICIFCLRWTPETEHPASFCWRFVGDVWSVSMATPQPREAHHLHPEDAEQTVQFPGDGAELRTAQQRYHLTPKPLSCSQEKRWFPAALPRRVCLWVKWSTDYKSLMVYLFWESDRDFRFVIFETPEPVREPRLLLLIVRCSHSYLKHFYFFSSSCLIEQHPYFWIRQGQASVCGSQRFIRDRCESEVMLYHTHTHQGCHCFPPCFTSRSRQCDFVSVLCWSFEMNECALFTTSHDLRCFFKDGGRWSLKSSFLILLDGYWSVSDSRRDFWNHCHRFVGYKRLSLWSTVTNNIFLHHLCITLLFQISTYGFKKLYRDAGNYCDSGIHCWTVITHWLNITWSILEQTSRARETALFSSCAL